jgi:hypothetical protein
VASPRYVALCPAKVAGVCSWNCTQCFEYLGVEERRIYMCICDAHSKGRCPSEKSLVCRLCLFGKFTCRALHPQLCVPPVRKLEVPRQRLRILAFRRSIYENRLEMECSNLRLVVLGDLHGEEAVRGSVVGDEWRVATPYNDLSGTSVTRTFMHRYMDMPCRQCAPLPQSDPQ